MSIKVLCRDHACPEKAECARYSIYKLQARAYFVLSPRAKNICEWLLPHLTTESAIRARAAINSHCPICNRFKPVCICHQGDNNVAI